MSKLNITVFHAIIDELAIENWMKISKLARECEYPGNKRELTDMFISGKCFVGVAELEDSTLDDAYSLTNNLGCGWWENDGVKALFDEPGCRSTSIGDLMLVEIPLVAKTENDAIAHYELYVVATFGFVKIDG